jgi:hypothetical protein
MRTRTRRSTAPLSTLQLKADGYLLRLCHRDPVASYTQSVRQRARGAMKRGLALPELSPTLGPLGRRTRFFGAFVTVVICVWVLVRPQPYWAAILAAYAAIFSITVAPLVANDYFRLREPRGNPPDKTRINIAAPLSCLSAVLLIRAVLDMDTVEFAKAIFFGLLAGSIYALLLWVIVRRASVGIAVLIGVFLGPAALLHTNAATLSAEGYMERGVVSDKYVSSKPRRHVVVASVGSSKVELSVPKESFSNYAAGQDICTEVRTGAFGIHVRFIRAC